MYNFNARRHLYIGSFEQLKSKSEVTVLKSIVFRTSNCSLHFLINLFTPQHLTAVNVLWISRSSKYWIRLTIPCRGHNKQVFKYLFEMCVQQPVDVFPVLIAQFFTNFLNLSITTWRPCWTEVETKIQVKHDEKTKWKITWYTRFRLLI